MTKRRTKSRASTASSQSSRAVIREVRKGKSFLVTTHENPDGDALGSALGLGAGLRQLGKKVRVYNCDPVPSVLRYLPNSGRVTGEIPEGERFDASFIVDCADLHRLGEAFARHRGLGKKIVLDHHARSTRGGDINLIRTEAASSGMVVYRLLKKMRVRITKEIAVALYCTLVTDTGSFRYSNTTAEVFELARKLVLAGADPWTASRNLFETFPKERLKLLGSVLHSLEISSEGRIATIVLAREMLRETGATEEMAEEFINFPRSIASVEVAVQFRETDKGYKISLRSKDFVDVAKIASRFGGGGHRRAAGCVMEGSLEEVREKILAAVRRETALYKP